MVRFLPLAWFTVNETQLSLAGVGGREKARWRRNRLSTCRRRRLRVKRVNSVGRWHNGLRRVASNGRGGTDDHAGLIDSRPPDNTRVSKGVWGAPHHCFAGALPREAGAPPQNQRARPLRGRKGARGLRLCRSSWVSLRTPWRAGMVVSARTAWRPD